jgi:hypothetical protein
LKKQAKRGLKPSSTHPVRRFDSRTERKGICRRKRFIGNSAKCVLPDPLPETAFKILSTLGAKGVAEEAMVAAKLKAKSSVSRWVRLFKAAGALVIDEQEVPNSTGPLGKPPIYKPGTPRYYLLTPYGSKLITGSDNLLHFPVLFEDRPLIFRVIEREKRVIPWKPLGDVRFWRKKGVMLAGVTVELHEKLGPNKDQANVMIHPGPIKGFNVDELLADSAATVERVKGMLEATYGIVLSPKGELPQRKDKSGPIRPRWRVYDPIVRDWMEAGSVEVPGYGAADASPLPSKGGVRDPQSNEPHAEFDNPLDAKVAASLYPFLSDDPAKRKLMDGLYAPALIRDTHSQVSSLVAQISDLKHQFGVLTVEFNKVKAETSQVGGVMVELHRLADALSKLDNLDKLPAITEDLQRIVNVLSRVQNAEASESGGKGYVS